MAADRTRELGAVGNSGGEYEGRFWGGGGFSERSSATSIGAAYGRLFRLRKTAMLSRHWRLWLSFPSSPDPFSRRAAGNRLVRSFGLVRPCELGASSIGLAVVTAADRAAATFAAWGNEPLRPHIAGTSPFRGGFAGSTVQRLPPQRGFRVCGSGISYLWARPKGFAITLRKPTPPVGR